VKKKALYATYYEDFEAFKNAIRQTIELANGEGKTEIQSLLNLKFSDLLIFGFLSCLLYRKRNTRSLSESKRIIL